MTELPSHLWTPREVFEPEYRRLVARGWQLLAGYDVAVVGLARNCAGPLAANLDRVADLGRHCGHWWLHVETNDNQDATEEVLELFCQQHRQTSYRSRSLGRVQYSTEFAGRRTEALAEYRTSCQEWVRTTCPAVDLVVVVDFDAWGGWNQDGLAHGVAALDELPDASGMASVSLMQHRVHAEIDGTVQPTVAWLHYDAWALRLNSFWDDYTADAGGWKHQWLPPVGSPVVRVCSAFGGLAVYRTLDYLAGTYTGEDCEHVTFHASLAGSMYLDPAMRTIMHWVEHAGG
jgi:hypothetical protein